ncbi:uncharacterized protein LOC110811874 isoform X1 [Carica papaya]|uniref:uncharacterized protein LOC110811874 isoform X1 n=1 Tax=Carica papaya TaxID=3649 RepID=UPI000B8CAB78|nr:uncharacterized protein LOC110811874 isoform X1 [Carica papaya]XP_021894173.1 uncharacterized protein LOC110811874 isoform X1 [Carica papaya]XP_021894174.1 uncharacterized protein LOC110811874 isoform X1 [Carica papaya]
MEALYRKLHNKYERLKKKRLSEMDEINRDQEVKFLDYVAAAEELIQHLKSENNKLQTQVNDLRTEVASLRSSKDRESIECQKLLLEESQKNKALSEEVGRLQNLHQEGLSCMDRSYGVIQQNTPETALQNVPEKLNKRVSKKRSSESEHSKEEAYLMPDSKDPDDVMVREMAEDLSKGVLYDEQPECCKRTLYESGIGVTESGPADCMFRALIEYVMGMKFSIITQAEGISITALHQSSGYSFSLTWIDKATSDERQLLYRALSLGTFERVAPEWMREVLMFSTSMCPIFFERVARVIKLHC